MRTVSHGEPLEYWISSMHPHPLSCLSAFNLEFGPYVCLCYSLTFYFQLLLGCTVFSTKSTKENEQVVVLIIRTTGCNRP